ncbi:hypothetical protein MOR33_004001 [Salmonella enterica]|nr:hypothetical protein [Salmonella enterica]EGL7479693.1 hypothetical protein [Salmonella enterica]EIZ2335019.1 hypothetical protein [Salmonella enterica]
MTNEEKTKLAFLAAANSTAIKVNSQKYLAEKHEPKNKIFTPDYIFENEFSYHMKRLNKILKNQENYQD